MMGCSISSWDRDIVCKVTGLREGGGVFQFQGSFLSECGLYLEAAVEDA